MVRYLDHAHHFPRWEMIDSEILGGIDGLFISQKIAKCVNNGNRLKLSQVLDMYYSKRGLPLVRVENAGIKAKLEDVPSSTSYFAFNTESNNQFRSAFDTPDVEWFNEETDGPILGRFSSRDGITNACHRWKILRTIDRQKLKMETYFLAQVLQFSTSSLAISDEVLQKNCDRTVDRFFRYAGE